MYSTTVIIHSTKESAILPLNVSIGNIRPVLSTDTNVLEDAAEFTASQVANQWYSLVSARHAAHHNIDDLPTLDSDKIVNGGHAIHNSNLQEMAQDNLAFDSSILSPYLECTERHQANSFSPVGNSNIQPHSEEYFGKLLHALELDTYAHVPRSISTQLKSLLHDFQHVFICLTHLCLPLRAYIIIFLLGILLLSIAFLIAKAPQNFPLLRLKLHVCLS